MNKGLAIGTGLGILIGALMGGGTAIALGIGIGIVLGSAWDETHPPPT
jgi:hypothetical protein